MRTGGFGSWAAVGCHECRLRQEVCRASGGTAQASRGAPWDPLRAERPGTLPAPSDGLRGASSSGRSLHGEQDHTEVRRTEPGVDAGPGPATARVPSRSPIAPSEAASDTSGMSCGKMTLD